MPMNIFLKILGKVMGWDKKAEEHFQRFMLPQAQRLADLGVQREQIVQLVHIAIDHSDPTVIGLAPGSILRNMVDHIEAGEVTAEEIINQYS